LPELVVLHEDEELLVVDKPAGSATHTGGSELWGAVSQAAAAHCAGLPGAADRAGIVHRLDKDTSGVLVLAKTEAALAELQRQFREREVEKEYRAIVFGSPRFFSDWIEKPIQRDPRHPERMRIARGEDCGRAARTYWETVERFDGSAQLLCRPTTGRTHQIRVHLSSVGMPIVGDLVYRPRNVQGTCLPPGAPRVLRQCLHARRLACTHPASGERVVFEAPFPADIGELLEWLRGHCPEQPR